MKIAICDDSEIFRNEILNNIYICNIISEKAVYSQFSNAESLLETYSKGNRFDIIFMDVEMEEIDGINAGIKIRQYDKKAIIIFVSNYSKYAVSSYDCEAFYFIVKPIQKDKFKKVLAKAVEKYKLLNQYYIIKNKGEVRKLPIKDIFYVEIYRKHLIFHTLLGKYETVGKISEALNYLALYGFCQVHQGYLVNMRKIKEFKDYDVILENNEKVMMSIRKKADVLKEYTAFLEREI